MGRSARRFVGIEMNARTSRARLWVELVAYNGAIYEQVEASPWDREV